jgi:hypothetical protein
MRENEGFGGANPSGEPEGFLAMVSGNFEKG